MYIYNEYYFKQIIVTFCWLVNVFTKCYYLNKLIVVVLLTFIAKDVRK